MVHFGTQSCEVRRVVGVSSDLWYRIHMFGVVERILQPNVTFIVCNARVDASFVPGMHWHLAAKWSSADMLMP